MAGGSRNGVVALAVAMVALALGPSCASSKPATEGSGGAHDAGMGGRDGGGRSGGGNGGGRSGNTGGSNGGGGLSGAAAGGSAAGGTSGGGAGGSVSTGSGGAGEAGGQGGRPADALGGQGGHGGQGGNPLACDGDFLWCTIGSHRCVQNQPQACVPDSVDGCPIWVSRLPTGSCPGAQICDPSGESPICKCPLNWTSLCGSEQVDPPMVGDYCVTPGIATYATCRYVDSCYVARTDVPCPAGKTCKQAASSALVPEGTACE